MGGLRSSISRTLDLGRLSNAVSRPGIDPRVWVSYGVLTSDPVIDTDATDNSAGIFVEVMLMPSGTTETARVGAAYAGNGFGFYTPLKKDDEVLVCAPSGDPDEGLVVTQRLWSAADPPPAALANYPEDVTLVVESGKALRLNVAGGGKVYIGANDGTEPVALGQTLKDHLDALKAYIDGHTHTYGLAAGTTVPTPTSAPTASPSVPDVRATLAEVK